MTANRKNSTIKYTMLSGMQRVQTFRREFRRVTGRAKVGSKRASDKKDGERPPIRIDAVSEGLLEEQKEEKRIHDL